MLTKSKITKDRVVLDEQFYFGAVCTNWERKIGEMRSVSEFRWRKKAGREDKEDFANGTVRTFHRNFCKYFVRLFCSRDAGFAVIIRGTDLKLR